MAAAGRRGRGWRPSEREEEGCEWRESGGGGGCCDGGAGAIEEENICTTRPPFMDHLVGSARVMGQSAHSGDR